MIDKAYHECETLLKADEQKLHEVVEFLLANETMTGTQFVQCMEGKPIEGGSQTSMFDGFEEVPAEAPAQTEPEE